MDYQNAWQKLDYIYVLETNICGHTEDNLNYFYYWDKRIHNSYMESYGGAVGKLMGRTAFCEVSIDDELYHILGLNMGI